MWRDIVIGILLVVATLAVFSPVKNYGFTQYDDRDDVWGNRHINTGLSVENAKWAFSTTERANWIPLTRLSNQLDFTIFPRDNEHHKGLQHMVNLWLHAANVLLVFLVLLRLTRAPWASAMVAGLFALHPLHVESVAWIVERKDVLSTLFWLLTMGAYVLYVQRRDAKRYIFYGLAFLSMALGLMAKPMLVTLPFVLLLMDYWPLRRLGWGTDDDDGGLWRLPGDDEKEPPPRVHTAVALLEKIPFLALAAVSCYITYTAQQAAGAMAFAEKIKFATNLAYVPIAYVLYLIKTVWPAWPFELAVFYPFKDDFPLWQTVAAAVFLVAVTALVVWQIRRRPYLAVGWFWYLGTLVPVIGLVKVGLHSVADRYTYVPLLGIFIIVAWGATDLARRWRYRTVILAMAAAVVLVACGAGTLYYLQFWNGTYELFEHDVKVVGKNSVAYYNMGDEAILTPNAFQKAIDYYKQALDQDPTLSGVHNNIGWAETKLEEEARAMAARTKDAEAEAYLQKARKLAEDADFHYQKAVELEPKNASAHNNLGLRYFGLGKIDDAEREYKLAIQYEPKFAAAHNNLGLILKQRNELQAAASQFREAVEYDPTLTAAHKNLGEILIAWSQWREARKELQIAFDQNPSWPEVTFRLARLEATCPQDDCRNGPDAVEKALMAQRQLPPNVPVLDTLAAAYAETHRFDLAVQTIGQAIQLAQQENQTDFIPLLEIHLNAFKAGLPLRETNAEPAPTVVPGPASP